MEKFRAFLELLKKYLFWVLCGLIVVISFISWFLATSDVAKLFLTQKGKIESQFSLVGRIASTADHPSAKYIQQIHDIESGPLTKQVVGASTRLYREQLDNNRLPEVYSDADEQGKFKAAFENIWGRMEEIEKLPPSQQLDEAYRTRYRNHIEDHFPKLFDLIERRKVVDNTDDAAPSEPHRGPATKKIIGIVDWVDADQKIKAFFGERFRQGTGTPSTLDIMMAQEDLWVYETLLKVIRNTNNVGSDQDHYRKPDNHKVARIKQILAMDIGKDAVQSWTKCERALFNMPADVGNSGAPPTPAGSIDRNSPLTGRYVDDKGKPLLDPTQQPYGEFRMMPINLKVVIEQKEIPRLLAECANSAMRIDVRAVRILAQEPPPVDLMAPDTSGQASSGGGETGTTAPSPAMHPGMGGGPSGGDSGGGKGKSVYNEESADQVFKPVPVEVQGIIYIYNPPHDQKLGETADGNGIPAVPTTPSGGTPPSVAAPATVGPPSNTPARGVRP